MTDPASSPKIAPYIPEESSSATGETPSTPNPEAAEQRAARLIAQIDRLKDDAKATNRRYLIVMELGGSDYERPAGNQTTVGAIVPNWLRGAGALVYAYCSIHRKERVRFGFILVFEPNKTKSMYLLLLEW